MKSRAAITITANCTKQRFLLHLSLERKWLIINLCWKHLAAFLLKYNNKQEVNVIVISGVFHISDISHECDSKITNRMWLRPTQGSCCFKTYSTIPPHMTQFEKQSVCHWTGIDLAAYGIGSNSTMSMVQGLPLDLAPYLFVIIWWWLLAHFNSLDHFFFTFFKTWQTFALGVSIRLVLILLE